MLQQMEGFFKDMNTICKVLNIGQPVLCKPGASMSGPSRGQKALLRINKNYLLHM